MIIILGNCFLTSRDLKVSKVSLEPTERRELGYVKLTFCLYEVISIIAMEMSFFSQLHIN